MDDPGAKRGLLVMAVLAAAGVMLHFLLLDFGRGSVAYLAPLLLVGGLGFVALSHARAMEWADYERGARNGYVAAMGVVSILVFVMWLLR